MALNFPTFPVSGETYTLDTITWQFDGVAWNVIPAGSASFPNSYANVNVVGKGTLSAESSSDTLEIAEGSNVTIDINNNRLTISSTATATGGNTTVNDYYFSVAGDDSTQRIISSGETVQFIGGTGITTTTDTEGNVTITSSVSGSAAAFTELTDAITANITIDKIYEPAIAMIRVDNIGTTAYTMNSHYSGNNPSIYALAGTTIAFDLDAIPGHPFQIQDPLGNLYNTGLVHVDNDGTVSTGASAQGKDSGTLYWRIPESISGGYRYQSGSSVTMVGAITVKRLSVI